MMRILRFLFVGMLIFIAATIAAFVYLPWWQAVLVVLIMIMAILAGVRYLIKNLGNIIGRSLLKVIEIKSQVLRNADATVGSIEPSPPPPRQESEESEPPQPANFYRIDVTITPKPTTGPMSHWDLGDLQLVSFDAPATSMDKLADDGTDSIEGYPLQEVKVMTDSHFADDEQGKYEGPQQIRFVVAVPPHVRELKFQYYAEQFGKIQLPPAMPLLA